MNISARNMLAGSVSDAKFQYFGASAVSQL